MNTMTGDNDAEVLDRGAKTFRYRQSSDVCVGQNICQGWEMFLEDEYFLNNVRGVGCII